jgi:tol-pal system protein YbgF
LRRFSAVAVASVALSACALKGDVRRVEQQVLELRSEMVRADSARADFVDFTLQEIVSLQRQVLDTLEAQDRRLAMFRGTIRSDITEVQRQLMQIQELTGQSQQRLSELGGRLSEREQAPMVVVPEDGSDSTGATPPPAGGAQSSVDEVYQLGVSLLNRGSPQTARSAFQQLLQQYPEHVRAQDAQFHLAESWEVSDPDSAAAAYELVVQSYPNSPRAPTALYRLGLLAEQNGDMEAAQVYYTRVVSGYPQSDAAVLARTKLNPGF